jgi:acyl-CoA thioesterase
VPRPMTMTSYFETLKEAFHSAPITRMVPQTMEIANEGEVRITLHPDERYHHGGGTVHGGVLGILLDNAGWFACATVSEGNWLATAEFKINLLEAVPAAQSVVAVGRVLRRGRHLMHGEMEAIADGKKVAVGLGTYAVLPRKFKGL